MSDTEILRGGLANVNDTLSKGIPRRLMDKIIAALLAVVVFFVIGWGSIVWMKANASEIKNTAQDEQLKAIVDKIDGIGKQVEHQDVKLDRILERLPK